MCVGFRSFLLTLRFQNFEFVSAIPWLYICSQFLWFVQSSRCPADFLTWWGQFQFRGYLQRHEKGKCNSIVVQIVTNKESQLVRSWDFWKFTPQNVAGRKKWGQILKFMQFSRAPFATWEPGELCDFLLVFVFYGFAFFRCRSKRAWCTRKHNHTAYDKRSALLVCDVCMHTCAFLFGSHSLWHLLIHGLPMDSLCFPLFFSEFIGAIHWEIFSQLCAVHFRLNRAGESHGRRSLPSRFTCMC